MCQLVDLNLNILLSCVCQGFKRFGNTMGKDDYKTKQTWDSPVARYRRVMANLSPELIGTLFQHLLVSNGATNEWRWSNLSGDIRIYLDKQNQLHLWYVIIRSPFTHIYSIELPLPVAKHGKANKYQITYSIVTVNLWLPWHYFTCSEIINKTHELRAIIQKLNFKSLRIKLINEV